MSSWKAVCIRTGLDVDQIKWTRSGPIGLFQSNFLWLNTFKTHLNLNKPMQISFHNCKLCTAFTWTALKKGCIFVQKLGLKEQPRREDQRQHIPGTKPWETELQLVLIIWEMWSPLVCAFQRQWGREPEGYVREPACLLESTWILLQSAPVISESAAVILSNCSPDDTSMPGNWILGHLTAGVRSSVQFLLEYRTQQHQHEMSTRQKLMTDQLNILNSIKPVIQFKKTSVQFALITFSKHLC